MIQSIVILGRQPAIGMAELESLYGASAVRQAGSHAAGVDLPVSDIDFNRLGGSTRLASVIGEVSSTDWRMIEKALIGLARSPVLMLPSSGKLHLGLSAIGFSISPAKLGATGLTLKKVIRSRYDGSVRLAPNTTAELSTAQVFHNHLTGENGCELLIIAQGNTTVIARTVAVQDIDSYTLRDRGRPRRDARVGMLPPKLAQIIINLAVGGIGSSLATRASRLDKTILDPFCGTGVILQEALLMGYAVCGTDLEPRMITYSRANLDWLREEFPRLESRVSSLDAGDATSHQWEPVPDFVACETYLGRPFTDRPTPDVLAQTITDVNLIIKKFLRNVHSQLKPGSRLCVAVPAWFVGQDVKHLPVIGTLGELGFKRVVFEHALNQDLIYHREDQIVGRELLVLQST